MWIIAVLVRSALRTLTILTVMRNCSSVLVKRPQIIGGGTDAVNTLVDFCFKHLNLHKIYLHVFESNKRAIRCYEKAGFHVEGNLLEHHFGQGKYETVLVMGRIFSP